VKSRVSSTVTKTKTNPRPRKYASASERQAAYRARAPEVCFRAEAKTVETLDRIADTLDQSRADVLLSMTKFALANHDWARFGLTHKPLPFEYGVNPIMATKKRTPTPAQRAARERFAEMARSGAFKKAGGRKANPAKKTHVWRITVFDDDGKPAKVTTDSTEQGALLYAKRKADANLSGEIHYILPKSERLEFWFDGTGIHPAGSYGNRPIYTTRRAALKTNPARKAAGVRGRNEAKDTKKDDPAWIGYALHRPSSPSSAFAILKTKDEAIGYAQELADRKKTPFAVTRIRYKVAQG